MKLNLKYQLTNFLEQLSDPVFRERIFYDYFFWKAVRNFSSWLSDFLDKQKRIEVSFSLRRKIDNLYQSSERAVKYGRPFSQDKIKFISCLQKNGVSDQSIRRLLVGKFIEDGFIRNLNWKDTVNAMFFHIYWILSILAVVYLAAVAFDISGNYLFTLVISITTLLYFIFNCIAIYKVAIIPNKEAKKIKSKFLSINNIF